MIETIFEGSKYRFCKDKGRKYWIGISGRGSMYPGNHCVAPSCMWGILEKTAIESGISKEEFICRKEVKEKKSRVSSKKNNGPSISIF